MTGYKPLIDHVGSDHHFIASFVAPAGTSLRRQTIRYCGSSARHITKPAPCDSMVSIVWIIRRTTKVFHGLGNAMNICNNRTISTLCPLIVPDRLRSGNTD